MSTLAKSSFRDETKLYLLYMAAGIGAIPAGICYALLAVAGWERWWNVLPLLALGLGSGLFVWKFAEKRFNAGVSTVVVAQTYSEAYTFGLREAGAIATATSLIMLYQQPSNQQPSNQGNSYQGEALTASHAAR